MMLEASLVPLVVYGPRTAVRCGWEPPLVDPTVLEEAELVAAEPAPSSLSLSSLVASSLRLSEPAVSRPEMDTFYVSVASADSRLSALAEPFTPTSVRPAAPPPNEMLARFRSGCRRAVDAVLPAPPPRSPVLRRRRPQAAGQLRRSVRVASRRAPASSVKRWQRLLISRLGLACEGEQISEGDLENYIRLFERPISQEHLNAILAIFGWTPDALPIMAGEAQDGLC